MSTQGKRRALGQHFLKDQCIANQIAEAAISLCVQYDCQSLLEIGPGKGALTIPLLERLSQIPKDQKMILVEKDSYFAQSWLDFQKAKNDPSLSPEDILLGDFLELPSDLWLNRSPLIVISNLPYAAATAILKRLAEKSQDIPAMILMFQAEVAQKLRALEGTKKRGSLSVWIQNLWDVTFLLTASSKAFSPPPEVDSEVVILNRRKFPRVEGTAEKPGRELWDKLLKISFSQKRKMLRSLLPWPKVLELSQVDGTKRAEALNWLEWNQLFQVIRKTDGYPSDGRPK